MFTDLGVRAPMFEAIVAIVAQNVHALRTADVPVTSLANFGEQPRLDQRTTVKSTKIASMNENNHEQRNSNLETIRWKTH